MKNLDNVLIINRFKVKHINDMRCEPVYKPQQNAKVVPLLLRDKLGSLK